MDPTADTHLAQLVPTEGCYQKAKNARIVGETPTQWHVIVEGESYMRRFRKSDMLHVSPSERSFPNYRLTLQQQASNSTTPNHDECTHSLPDARGRSR